jgi:hypothetical protein
MHMVHETFFNLRSIRRACGGTFMAAIKANYEQAGTRWQTHALTTLRLSEKIASAAPTTAQQGNRYGKQLR